MIVLSHRGYWIDPAEKNTRAAFERSFSMGFGTETDVRDRGGRLVISHDMADSQSMPVEDFFDIYCAHNKSLPLALNIKADGLQFELKKIIEIYGINNYFVFDMAVPDGLIYARNGFHTYTRHSEFEPEPAYYQLAKGVWLDEFHGHWVEDDVILKHHRRGKAICIVSPELHRREYLTEWSHYRRLDKQLGGDQLSICTDYPEQARIFFNAYY
ncbi:MAG: hypothetical protein ACKOWD_02535 [Rhodoferax sp.]